MTAVRRTLDLSTRSWFLTSVRRFKKDSERISRMACPDRPRTCTMSWVGVCGADPL